MRSSARFIRKNWSRRSRRWLLPMTPRRRPRRSRGLRWKRRVSRRDLTIQASPPMPHRWPPRKTRKHTRHRQNRMNLTRQLHRTTAATYRPARGPISRSGRRTARTSRSTVRAACAARCPSSVPTARKETNRSVDPGAGAKIRVKWIGGHGGASITKTKMRTTWSCSEEAAAGRHGPSSKSPQTGSTCLRA